MSVKLTVSDEIGARLKVEAERRSVSVDAVAEQVIAAALPNKVILNETPAEKAERILAMFQQWAEEDANLPDEEIERSYEALRNLGIENPEQSLFEKELAGESI